MINPDYKYLRLKAVFKNSLLGLPASKKAQNHVDRLVLALEHLPDPLKMFFPESGLAYYATEIVGSRRQSIDVVVGGTERYLQLCQMLTENNPHVLEAKIEPVKQATYQFSLSNLSAEDIFLAITQSGTFLRHNGCQFYFNRSNLKDSLPGLDVLNHLKGLAVGKIYPILSFKNNRFVEVLERIGPQVQVKGMTEFYPEDTTPLNFIKPVYCE